MLFGFLLALKALISCNLFVFVSPKAEICEDMISLCSTLSNLGSIFVVFEYSRALTQLYAFILVVVFGCFSMYLVNVF